jgi:RimJ/RimL family protein N-acetyltransferase
MEPIRGERVTIRPLRSVEFDAALRARVEAEPTTFAGTIDREALRRRVDSSGEWHGRAIDLAIELDGRLIGEIQTYEPPDRAPLPEGWYEIGIGLNDPADRGHGLGTDAFATFVRWLFEEVGAVRVQAPTHETNAAMRAVLTKLGFTAGGTAHTDEYTYIQHSLDREDWSARDR